VSCPTGRTFRHDGGKWVDVSRSDQDLEHAFSFDVSSDGGRAWIVGAHAALMQYGGGVWTSRAAGTSAYLRAIWTTVDGQTWVVGDGGRILSFRPYAASAPIPAMRAAPQ